MNAFIPEKNLWKSIIIGYFSYVLITLMALYSSTSASLLGSKFNLTLGATFLAVSLLISLPFLFVRWLSKSKKPRLCFVPCLVMILIYSVIILGASYYFREAAKGEGMIFLLFLLGAFIYTMLIHFILTLILTSIFYIIDSDNRIKKYVKKILLSFFIIMLVLIFSANDAEANTSTTEYDSSIEVLI